jgi:hypothetical protein
MLPTEPKVGWFFAILSLAMAIPREAQEGDNDRPVPAVRVLPITHTPPSDTDDAIEIPPGTKRRLGLDDERS